MSKFLAKKRLANASVDNIEVTSGYTKSTSFNKDSTYDGETKILIVGTFTPYCGRRAGYFYCSERNGLFSIIDYCFDDKQSLVDAKKELLDNLNDKFTKIKKIEQIKKILNKRKIAFLDVIKEAISPYNDPSDDAILSYVLDYDSFKKMDFNKIDLIIANSKNALVALEYILGHLFCFSFSICISSKIVLLPQSVRGRRPKGSDKMNVDKLKDKWKETIQKSISKNNVLAKE